MLSRNNLFICIALVALSVVAWVVTVHEAGGMGWGMFTCSMTMGTPVSLRNGVLYVMLWGVMMVAMMLPAMTPIVGLFRTIARRKQEQGLTFTPAWVFIAGYITLWTLTGGLGYAADVAIQSLPARVPALRTYGMVIGGLTLVGAGLYQLTPLKYLCLSQCRSPLGFLLGSWRDGYRGAFRMGVHHGLYCLGCCWSLMVVLFVVGTMNLVWMGLLSAVIFAEKIVPHGVEMGKASGIVLIVLGLALSVGIVDGGAVSWKRGNFTMMQLEEGLVGKEFAIGDFAITADEIAEFARAVGDLNPLYLDPDAATQAGYPAVIAPPTFCMHLRGGRMVPEVPLAPGFTSLHAGQEFEFYDDIHAGRTYTAVGKLVEVYEKTGRSGPLGVIVREMVVRDAAGKTVLVLRERQMVRSPEKKI